MLYAIKHRTTTRDARSTIERAMSESGSRFIGLENVTADRVRKWSIAPKPPRKAIAALTGNGKQQPAHIMPVWSADCSAWRSVDLTTVRRVWWTTALGIKREVIFAG